MMMYQVNKLINTNHIINAGLQRYMSCVRSVVSSSTIYPLNNRGIIKVLGKESAGFLQGLITNDMRHFEKGTRSIYAMFLNNKGRVLYDTLIYKCKSEDSFMIECDSLVASQILKHLKIYKLRRSVDFQDLSHQYKVWALVHPATKFDSVDVIQPGRELNIYRDPRLADLGYRIITDVNLSGEDLTAIMGINIDSNEQNYKYLRYMLGVSEGAQELSPGETFPLEVNCDYLHGVSFHKGCYIGQELTARVHHTGVIRKRIMPLQFSELVNETLEKDVIIQESKNLKSIGKLKGFFSDYGLGLVRIKEALEAKDLKIGKYSALAIKPAWWPIEAPKEKAALKSE